MRIKLSSYFVLFFLTFACNKKSIENLKIFRYNQAEGISSLDPAFARNQGNIWGVSQIFNGLVELDEHLKINACIAKSWKINTKGTQYIFNLRKDVFFHTDSCFGPTLTKKVVAQDFVYSFKRIIDKKTLSTGAWIFNNKLKKENDSTFSDSCFFALNDSTLIINLARPFPAFLELLSMPYASVVPKEAIEKYKKEFRIHPVGTGAFQIQVWDENTSLILKKNTTYWKSDTLNQKLPYLDAIQISFVKDKNLAFLDFEKGNLDLLSGIDESSRDLLLNQNGVLKNEYTKKYNLQKLPYLNTEYIGILIDSSFYEDKKHPLLNLNFRKALNYAINRKELIMYLRNHVGIPGTQGIIPPSLQDFSSSELKGYDYNAELTQIYLRKSGYKSGKEKPIKLYTTSFYMELSEYLQKEWNRAGIAITIELNPSSTHLDLVTKGKASFFRGSWLGDYADGENYLSLLYSANFSPIGPNRTHFKNEKFDLLYKQAMQETDPKKRRNLYLQMEKLFLESAPMIILYYDEIMRLMQKNISGLQADAMNSLRLEYVNKIQ